MPELGTRALVLKVGGTDFSSSVSDVRLTANKADTDFVSFADAAAGGAREYALKIKMKQNTDSTALWYFLWNSAGTTVAVEVWPNGYVATPTTTKPKVSGTVTITEPDGDILGGEANQSTSARFTTEVEWVFTAKPTLVTA